MCSRLTALVLLVATLLSQPSLALAENPTVFDEQTEPVQLVAIDYCFSGSIEDPITGETVDLYVLCPEDGFEQNIDFA